jgi:hypothetical protein
LVLLNNSDSLINRVLSAFHRPQQSILAAGYEQQQPILRPTERRNQLGTILDSQSAGGSSADIDQPAAISQPRLSGDRRPHNSEAGGSYRGHCRELPLDHCLGDV